MSVSPREVTYYTLRNIDALPQFGLLSPEEQWALRVVGQVLPFRVNSYVVDELIDWTRVPDDPMFQLTFMQRGMLSEAHFSLVSEALRREAPRAERDRIVRAIRAELNPHPAGQMTANVPELDNEPVPGLQHKYRETCLVFPRNGQTCHSYCTFCFRWPQFVGGADLRFATDQARRFLDYLAEHREITDVLLTGGDPMIMSARNLAVYIEPLLGPGYEHIQTIRIGTKSLTYWPYRFLSDADADDVLRLFEKVTAAGKHLALMAHFNHWKESDTPAAQEAIRRVRGTGAQIRTQSPLVRHINDDPDVWQRMWKDQVRLGCVPYYMFVERDTGSKTHFSVPLARAYTIFQGAYQRVSGLARTVRGPSMSTFWGKVVIEGTTMLNDERVFVLSYIQAREADRVRRPFFARFDPEATWFTQLKPVAGSERLFPSRPAHRGSADVVPGGTFVN
ncbi:MAG: hypothetical protein R2834_11400 [Rhodothermales bacterium]